MRIRSSIQGVLFVWLLLLCSRTISATNETEVVVSEERAEESKPPPTIITDESVSEDKNETLVVGWSEWSECSKECGGGVRTRTCLNEDENECEGVSEEICNEDACPEPTKVFNYASIGAGAQILAASEGTKEKESVLIDDDDRYLMTPCQTKSSDSKTPPVWWFVVQLSEDIVVESVVISHYELYSSSVNEFMVLGSATYPTDEWQLLGTFKAQPKRGEEVFRVNEMWARYLKIRVLSHHGDEFYCTLTSIKVYGSTALDGLQKEFSNLNQDLEELLVTTTTSETPSDDDGDDDDGLEEEEEKKTEQEEKQESVQDENIMEEEEEITSNEDTESDVVVVVDDDAVEEKEKQEEKKKSEVEKGEEDEDVETIRVEKDKEENRVVNESESTNIEDEKKCVEEEEKEEEISTQIVVSQNQEKNNDEVDPEELRGPMRIIRNIVDRVISSNDEKENVVVVEKEKIVHEKEEKEDEEEEEEEEKKKEENIEVVEENTATSGEGSGVLIVPPPPPPATTSTMNSTMNSSDATDRVAAVEVVKDEEVVESTPEKETSSNSTNTTSVADPDIVQQLQTTKQSAEKAEEQKIAKNAAKKAEEMRKPFMNPAASMTVDKKSRSSKPNDVFGALTGQIRSIMLNQTLLNQFVVEINKNLAEQIVRNQKLEERIRTMSDAAEAILIEKTLERVDSSISNHMGDICLDSELEIVRKQLESNTKENQDTIAELSSKLKTRESNLREMEEKVYIMEGFAVLLGLFWLRHCFASYFWILRAVIVLSFAFGTWPLRFALALVGLVLGSSGVVVMVEKDEEEEGEEELEFKDFSTPLASERGRRNRTTRRENNSPVFFEDLSSTPFAKRRRDNTPVSDVKKNG